MPADHPEPVILKHPGERVQRLQVGGVDLGDPAAQVLLGGLGMIDFVEAVELLSERVRTHGLERLGEQFVEQIALTVGQVRRPLEPHVPRVGQQPAMMLDLFATDLIDRLGEMRLDVVTVERDLRRREVRQRALQERLRHVLADLLHLPGIAAVRLQEQRERLHRLVIAALDHEHAAALVQIGEHRHIVMPTPRAGLIDPDPLHPVEVLPLDRLIDVMMHDPPDPHVRLADQAGQRRDRHLADHRHHQRLEQQREPRPRPRPRHRHQPHLMLGALHPRHPRGQVRLMLKEVQMPPRLLLGVMHLQPRPVALRAREPRSLREVEPQIQPLGLRVELDAQHLPRVAQPERGLEENKILRLHATAPHHRRSEAGQAISRPGRYPPSTWRSRRSWQHSRAD